MASDMSFFFLREEAWKHFASPSDWRVFDAPTAIHLRDPGTGAALGRYRLTEVLAPEHGKGASFTKPPPPLCRFDPRDIFCSGRCPQAVGYARCADGSFAGQGHAAPCMKYAPPFGAHKWPLCGALSLQLHPQAEVHTGIDLLCAC